MHDLSIIIPARNEMFLSRTVEDIIKHVEANTEIIVVLDGAWASPGVAQHPIVTVVYHPTSIGQRAASNEAARIADGKYIMKVDAHCSFDQGFDRKMLEAMKLSESMYGQDKVTMVPVMKNLHAFNWKCPAGHTRYQGPSGVCKECGQPTEREMIWQPRKSPNSKSYCFDATPHFQYFGDFNKRPEGKGDITETMSLQGSCFMLSKKSYFDLNICDEAFGSWGSQGIEVAVKTWLSGGKVLVNHNTWYAHMFRTQGGDFSFPYPQSGRQVEAAKKTARDLFFNNKWPLQKRPLHWLVEKFWPVPGWTEADLKKIGGTVPSAAALKSAKKPTKGVLYYTHNVGDEKMLEAVRKQINKGMKNKHIMAVSRSPITFGQRNIVVPQDPKASGWEDMFTKIIKGLEAMDSDIVFFCEHDVLYHPSHFDFIPPRKDAYYYNNNLWKWRYGTDFCLKVDDCKQLSGLVAWRDLLIEHYRERLRRVQAEGFTRGNGFEPGTRNMKNGGYDDFPAIEYLSKYPNIDIRHDTNATQNRWRKDQFRNQKYTAGWTEGVINKIPGWDDPRELLK